MYVCMYIYIYTYLYIYTYIIHILEDICIYCYMQTVAPLDGATIRLVRVRSVSGGGPGVTLGVGHGGAPVPPPSHHPTLPPFSLLSVLSLI